MEDADLLITHVRIEPGTIAAGKQNALLDASRSGFRAAHSSPLLETGSRVQFRSESEVGVARVCWNRTSGGRWETGFLILPK